MSNFSLARTFIPLTLCLACAAVATEPKSPPLQEASNDLIPVPIQAPPEIVFEGLMQSDDEREAYESEQKLLRLGDEALAASLDDLHEGTHSEDPNVRAKNYETLREQHPTGPRSVEAFLRGLQDSNRSFVAYPCAFHLGEYKIASAREALRACLSQAEAESRTFYAAAKSLGELGDKNLMVTLWSGLGSDDTYTRYLCNLGVKGLAGKDLTDFEYEGPFEGAFVSGPAVMTMQGQPLQKAQKRVARWQAIVRFTQWLAAERPELIARLDKGLW